MNKCRENDGGRGILMKYIGMLAKSLAGHDKDKVYVIIGEDAEYVYLSEGRLRMTDNPKRKKKKHIQCITRVAEDNTECQKLFEEVAHRLNCGESLTNEQIKRLCKLYNAG